MKNSTWMFLVFLAMMLTSCSITEKLVLDQNGSGKFSYDIDCSKLMSMAGNAFDSKDEKPKKKLKNSERVSKVIDSTFSFKELFASKQDSIAKLSLEEQEKIKRMEKFNVQMVMNEEKGIMKYSMFTDFVSVKELQDVMSPVESMKTLPPGGQSGGFAMAPEGVEEKLSTKFFYD